MMLRIVRPWLVRRLVTLMPMPKLSPTNETCKILKWHISEGSELNAYSLLCDVETTSLTQTSNEISQLEIEIQEDCTVLKILRFEGEVVDTGCPIAVFSDDPKDVLHPSTLSPQFLSIDTYEQKEIQMASWQAYMKTGLGENSCGCS
jgi:pyruvate/2-oxoglutarate dehydrogenase complex dihydrolipoamide acyltransferase (E2) component